MIDKGEKGDSYGSFYLSILLFSLTKSLMKYVHVSLWTPHRILVTVYSDFDRGVFLLETSTQLLEITCKNHLIVSFEAILIFKLCI